MTDPQKPENPEPDDSDDDLPKLTAEEWAYIQAVADAEKGDD
jgi:hypothetical protein